MRIKRVNMGWSSMTGFGPAAWEKDHQTLKMHTPHHEKHQHIKHPDKGEKAATDQDEAETPHKEQ